MNKIVIANFKMKLSLAQSQRLLREIKKISHGLSVAVAPDFLALETAISLRLKTVAQDCYSQSAGAYTGEISPLFLQKMGVAMVILGHSERRHILGETDKTIADKVRLATECGLEPILCVGEKIKKSFGYKVAGQQLENCLVGVSKKKNITIAYEPVWAIGTGKVISAQEVIEAHSYLREKMESLGFKKFRIIYGGSVDEKNAKSFNGLSNVAGLLVGSASLKSKNFIKIVKDFK
jgi:triosephosphate isomerase